jgi:hypothetical protein
MSIPWLIVSALLVGFVTYRTFYTLVTSVRLIGALVLMAGFIAIVQSREIIGPHWASFGHSRFLAFADKRTQGAPNSSEQSDPAADLAFQTISREDHIFLDEFLQQLNRDGQPQLSTAGAQIRNIGKAGIFGAGDESALRAEWVLNTAQGKRAEPVTRKETVKRAELVNQNESSKRAELVRSRHR